MMAATRLELPLDDARVRALRAGDFVQLCGSLFTARDAVHECLAGGGAPPCDLHGAAVYHCGPVIVETASGWRVTAAGPTTSSREEPFMAALIERFGLRVIVGKGGMGPGTLAACQQHGCVYCQAVGGAAQVLAAAVQEVVAVHWRERFGSPEAIWELRVRDFPAIVTMDSHGKSLHADVLAASRQRLDTLDG